MTPPVTNSAALRALLLATSIAPALFAAPAHAKPAFRVIHSFTGGNDGTNPNQLTAYQSDPNDPSSWALYGTARHGGGAAGGANCNGEGGCGVVFQLAKTPGKNTWRETRLHVFSAGAKDGDSPYAGVVFDKSGALYGTTGYGGKKTGNGHGTVFRLTRPASGRGFWKETVLTRFPAASNGEVPVAGVTIGASGEIYGTAWHGGANNYGTIFQLTPPAPGATAWTQSVLYNFTGNADGGFPEAPLLVDATGALYGTANFGGAWGNGTAFKLTPPAAGQTAWTNTVLTSFDGPHGVWPSAVMVADASGALYGTTTLGGYHGEGAIFKLTPPAAGQTAWTETVLYSFTGGTDGGTAGNPVLLDASGALYGVTGTGGDLSCSRDTGCGVVFKLTPPAAGQTAWTETVLHAFSGPDGASGQGVPAAGLVAGPDGVLYGSVYFGGKSDNGTVFEITP